ncbi:competence pheromone ComX [Solibacillus sp. FSL W7-1472]|uniref:ComX pheromone n=1 Tax=Solibacillus isronensis B3W22 TaxID=1224748 RepID=K1L2C5_9BACL|nr:competence pheromone ComX [Solibacillus isronensis]AMO85177.1 competence protein ComX [Solibacillus silvestris]EKB44748.1 Competence pheromone ComX [Solibacillus isronensis B3W22]
MLKIIQYFKENPTMFQLLKEEKISLIGVSEVEKVSILEAFEEDVKQESAFWG